MHGKVLGYLEFVKIVKVTFVKGILIALQWRFYVKSRVLPW